MRKSELRQLVREELVKEYGFIGKYGKIDETQFRKWLDKIDLEGAIHKTGWVANANVSEVADAVRSKIVKSL